MSRKRVSCVSRWFLLPVIMLMVFAASAFAVEPGMVNTVLGPMSVDKLGWTLPHEHFQFGYPGYWADETMYPYDRKEAQKIGLETVKKAQKYGIKTIVDATPSDVGGRDPRLYKELAEKTGMNIIFSTGLYNQLDGGPMYFRSRMLWYGEDIAKTISEVYIKEINDGVGKTGIKPGVIKFATSTDFPFSAYETAVLKASVIAAKATGVPIITHTEGPVGGPGQADLFLKEGMNPLKVMVGHVSNSSDINYHRKILSKGVYIGFDRVGIDSITPAPVLAGIIAQLCKEGYANQMLLSQDTVNLWMGRPYPTPAWAKVLFANYRIDFIAEKFIPMLKSLGVTNAQIQLMTVENPKNLFLGKRAEKM